ncbi:GtrA family protein [Stenotrophomonas acidaminiphila]|uniref:GtrA family protein n=1 Tax=Stenotrophomonas acidaminiphila TaxID=128780 RepID=UPI002ABE110E|nr:GtrA family protein [Stenotrophomonas acidaminiphila]WPU55202.1 GtrA family protein [Stenotrophomonas acidaminiphila]
MRIPALYRSTLLRYFVASFLALLVDVAVLSLSLRLLHMSLAWAATAGFVVGAVVAYILSIRWVFSERALANTPWVEFLGFVGIGVVGLGVTQFVLWLGTAGLGIMPELVKLAAAAASFLFNYLARRSLLFIARSRIARGEDLV